LPIPLLVTKKLVAADCACAGWAATNEIAARAAGAIMLAKFFIWFLPFVFGSPSFNPLRHRLFRPRDGEINQAQSIKRKGAAE
jgi:hypothetical protein